MRRVTYRGVNPVNLGRFGIVTPGQALQLTEDEYSTVSGDSEFRLDNAGEYEQNRRGVMPTFTDAFDLRTIAWNSGRVSNRMHNKSKRVLLKIAKAMRSLGIHGVTAAHECSGREIADSIVAGAAIEGWTSMDRGHITGEGEEREVTPGDLSPPSDNKVARKRPRPVA